MSDAKRCDRCGGFYTLDISDEKDDVAGFTLLDKYGRKISGEYDFCQKCRKELMGWLNEKGVIYKVCANCKHDHTDIIKCADCVDKSNWEDED